MDEIKRKRGRPREEGSMQNQYRLRMDDNMSRRLDDLSRDIGKSKADIFREAFRMYENYERSKLPDPVDYGEIVEYFDEDFDEDYD